MSNSYFLLRRLTKLNRNESLVHDLFYLQFLITISLTLINLYALFYVFTNNYLEITQNQVTTIVLYLTLFTHSIVSNYIRFFILAFIETWLLIYSFQVLNVDFGQVMLLNLYLIINVLFLLINQKVLITNFLEKCERVDINFDAMHDIRNYIYSYIELENLDKIDRMNDVNNNFDLRFSKNNSKISRTSSINNENNSCISNNYNIKKEDINTQSHDDTINKSKILIYRKNTNGQIITKIDYFNECEQKDDKLMFSMDFFNKENYYHQKYILYKICFLYHIELIYENRYTLQTKEHNVRELILKTCDIMKIIFMNKNNSIKVQLFSYVKNLALDANIFEYLLIELTRMFHDQGTDNLTIKILVQPKRGYINLVYLAELHNIHTINVSEVENKTMIHKLIESLHIDIKYKYKWCHDAFIIEIKIPNEFKRPKTTHKSLFARSDNLGSKKVTEYQLIDGNKTDANKGTSEDDSFYNYNDTNNEQTINELTQSIFSKTNLSHLSDYIHHYKYCYYNSIQIKIKKSVHSNLDVGCKVLNEIKSEKPFEQEKVDDFIMVNFENSYEEEYKQPDPLTMLCSNVPHLEVFEKDGFVIINVDDEENILKMNSRVCKKSDVSLNCCRSIEEFLNLLINIHRQFKEQSINPVILGLMDHMMDREYGYEAIDRAKEVNSLLNLNITFVLLSSTEDKDTLDCYYSRGVNTCIPKPLNKAKLKPILDDLYEKNVVQNVADLSDIELKHQSIEDFGFLNQIDDSHLDLKLSNDN